MASQNKLNTIIYHPPAHIYAAALSAVRPSTRYQRSAVTLGRGFRAAK